MAYTTLFDTISLPSNENHQKRGFKSGQYLLGNKTLYTEKQRKPENVAILEYQAKIDFDLIHIVLFTFR